jgi:hypothetical protein
MTETKSSDATQSAEALAEIAKAKRLAALSHEALELFERGRSANIKLGHVFIEIKELVGHGKWEEYFVQQFAPRGIPIRTAQDYMNLAAREGEASKNAKSAFLTEATDPQARAMKQAVENARAKIAQAAKAGAGSHESRSPKARVRPSGILRVPLLMSGVGKNKFERLMRSGNWPWAQKEILDLIEKHCVYSGVSAPTAQNSADHCAQTPDPKFIARFPRVRSRR